MAKFETVPLVELKTRLPAKLMPLVEEYKEKLEKLSADQGGKLVLGKRKHSRFPVWLIVRSAGASHGRLPLGIILSRRPGHAPIQEPVDGDPAGLGDPPQAGALRHAAPRS